MRLTLLCALTLGLCYEVTAADSASREFERQAEALGQSISESNAPESAHCATLRKEIETLKGSPQRRHTAREAYRTECLRHAPGGADTKPRDFD